MSLAEAQMARAGLGAARPYADWTPGKPVDWAQEDAPMVCRLSAGALNDSLIGGGRV